MARVLADPPFTDRWLRELADQGVLVKAGRAQYDLARSVRGYIRHIRETEVKRAQDASSSREQFERERARKLQLENDTRVGMLVETSDAMGAIDHILGMVRTSLAAIPPRAAPDDLSQRRRIEDAIDAVLADLATRLDQAGAALQAGLDPLDAGSAHHA